ncbi:MAG: phage terminase small subunit P27 family [Opitutales bacterium]|nr:phage terminase small subunit P27 family [Opitutales bacterium]
MTASNTFTHGLTPPSWFTVKAKNEFHRVAQLLSDRCELDSLDQATLEVYAINYEKVMRLGPKVRKAGETLHNPEKGTRYPNPDNNALISAMKSLGTASEKLGLSPKDRSKIFEKKDAEDEDELTEFEKERGLV